MRDLDMEKLDRWQADVERSAEMSIVQAERAIDDMTDDAKGRHGAHILRANFKRLREMRCKLNDLMIELTPFAEAAE